MYKLISAILILLLAISSTTLIEAQLDKSKYPPQNKTPPLDPAWAALVDQSKVPKAPIRSASGTTGCDLNGDPFCVWSCTICIRPQTDVNSLVDKDVWALTYDDGPTEFSMRVVDALNERDIKATFFVIGSKVLDNPDILKKTADSGHQIGVHTWSHQPLTTLTNEQIIAEVKWTEKIIKDVTGLTPKWFRPPQGDFDDRVRAILTQLGYKTAIWNRDTFDWMSNEPNSTYDLNWIPGNFTEWVKNTTAPIGFISLEHDAYNLSSSMASKGMDIIMKSKFRPESLSVALNDPNPYVEKITLPKSKVKKEDLTTNNNSTGMTNGANSIEKNVSLSVLGGLILTVFGFIQTIYI